MYSHIGGWIMSKDVNRIYWQIEKFKENKVLKNKQRKNGTHFVLRNNGSSLFNVERCVVSLHTHWMHFPSIISWIYVSLIGPRIEPWSFARKSVREQQQKELLLDLVRTVLEFGSSRTCYLISLSLLNS